MKKVTLDITIDTVPTASKQVSVLRLDGELDAHTFQFLEQAFETAFQSGSRDVIVDFNKLRYMSSAGAGVLIRALADADGHDGRVVLMGKDERIWAVLDLLGLREIFAIVEDQGAALRAIQQPRHVSVLVVDDDPDIRDVLSYTLENAGFPVYVAADATIAVNAISQHAPRVILLDYFLPGAPPDDVVAWVRQKQLASSIILITAATNPADKARELGLKDFLAKPLDCDQLIAKIRSCVTC